MSVEQLILLSRVFFIISMVLLVTVIVLFQKFNIYKAWHIVMGKQIKENHNRKTIQNKMRQKSNDKKTGCFSHITDTIKLQEFQIKYDVTLIHTKIKI